MDNAFFEKLLNAFAIEARDHLAAISNGLMALESKPADEESHALLETIFRAAHSLKGAARSVDKTHIESLCHPMESVLAALKKGAINMSPALLDMLHQTADAIGPLIESKNPPSSHVFALEKRLQAVAEGKLADQPSTTPLPAEPSEYGGPPGHESGPKTVRIPEKKLDAILVLAEKLLTIKQSVRQEVMAFRKTADEIKRWERRWKKISSEVLRIREQPNPAISGSVLGATPSFQEILDLLDQSETHLSTMKARIFAHQQAVETADRSVQKRVEALLSEVKSALMLPFSTILAEVPKLVRDLSASQGKTVDLHMEGTEIALDKRILEEMKSPLRHLLRNCIDHGIESPEGRTAAGKNPRGRIHMSISQPDSRQVTLRLSDDGTGIDMDAVKAKAVDRDILTQETVAAMADDRALQLIFLSDVSTSPIITDLSGRGLGLSIVQEKIEEIGGTISVDTRKGAGTTFTLRLPLSMTNFRGILTQSAGQLFIFPTALVLRILRLRESDIKTVEDRETIMFQEKPTTLVALTDILKIKSRPGITQSTTFPAVIVASVGQQLALRVEEVIGEQEVLVKNLSYPLKRVRHIAGAARLGSGKVALVLHVADLLATAQKATFSPTASIHMLEAVPAKSILVVEDSITSRTLIKNILISSGYDVKTAVDGADGWAAIQSGSVDLVVSDVQMPKMDGFDLTARIRESSEFNNVPVVLVTGLESSEDRRRGIDVGANAYIVKSRFDQSNLLTVIQRLI